MSSKGNPNPPLYVVLVPPLVATLPPLFWTGRVSQRLLPSAPPFPCRVAPRRVQLEAMAGPCAPSSLGAGAEYWWNLFHPTVAVTFCGNIHSVAPLHVPTSSPIITNKYPFCLMEGEIGFCCLQPKSPNWSAYLKLSL